MSEGNRRRELVSVEAVASGSALLLSHPALTPMPEELRPASERRDSARAVAVGGVVRRRERSKRGYDAGAPWAGRTVAAGLHADMRQHLESARELVLADWSLLDVVGDGTLWGWRLRMVLSGIVGEALANWDVAPGRTQAERLAVVDRALGELAEQSPRGGWMVTDGGVE